MHNYLGHSANACGREESLKEHLEEATRYAALFGKELGIQDESTFCSMFHDLAKMGIAFDERIHGVRRHVDHWTYGAYTAKQLWGSEGLATTLAILGHHTGLPALRDAKNLSEDEMEEDSSNLTVSKPASDEERDRFLESLDPDPRTIPNPAESICSQNRKKEPASIMMDIRMLYSILVDADFLATEGHFRGTPEQRYYSRPKAPSLCPTEAFARLTQFMDKVRKNALSSEKIRSIREDLMKYVLKAADENMGTFTLTSPTGSGKTLAMLAFALKHAMKHNLKRIIIVIPFLSIIEQTAKIYRDVFCDHRPLADTQAPYILEDHSQARLPTRRSNQDDFDENIQGIMAENWDAPIIITTNIQFFESLFSNRPGACRKLHRLANSVILFDEVQTFPPHLAVPTLATLGRLCKRFNSTLVMSTATQPAFTSLSNEVKKLGPPWAPKEIVGIGEDNPEEALKSLFRRSKRTKVSILNNRKPVSWAEIARQMVAKKKCLCVVNMKKHAQQLIDEIKKLLPHNQGQTPKGLYHLSTSMCPAHRKEVLNKVREELQTSGEEQIVILVATQCIEAGVDIDFPILFRALAPLDSMAQAAGRCNRNQLLAWGEVYLFMPEDEVSITDSGEERKARIYPGGAYQQAAETAIRMIENETLDLDDPELYNRYFKELYDLSGAAADPTEPVANAVKDRDFPKVAEEYRLIEADTINILVPYDQNMFDQLVHEVEETGLTGDWTRRARDFTVTYYRSAQDKLLGKLVPIRIKNQSGKASNEEGMVSDDWFYLGEQLSESQAYYDQLKGLCVNTDDLFVV